MLLLLNAEEAESARVVVEPLHDLQGNVEGFDSSRLVLCVIAEAQTNLEHIYMIKLSFRELIPLTW